MQKTIHHQPEYHFLTKIFFFVFAAIGLFIAPEFNTNARAETPAGTDSLPSEYGRVIFRCNEKSPNQLYIIAIGHRSTVTLANGNNTAKAQAEVYRIGAWLVQKTGLGLILPEGYFAQNQEGLAQKAEFKVEAKPQPFDAKTLERRLSDTSVFTNAEMLLIESYYLKPQQIEDRKLYDAVRSRVFKLESDSNPYSLPLIQSELDYLQEMRTASMLQRIPDVIGHEYEQGSIGNKGAIFTIGLNHIDSILRYLKENKIVVTAPAFSSDGDTDYVADLNLLKENFGITVIIPKTLADDPEALKATHLDKVIMQ